MKSLSLKNWKEVKSRHFLRSMLTKMLSVSVMI